METKVLDLHPDKSCYIIIGKNQAADDMRSEILLHPLTLYGKEMKEKKSERYLGDVLHGGGLAASAEATVAFRHAKMIHGLKEIKAIVEDCRSNTMGGLKVGLDIWETAYVPSLLNNCSTWMEIEDATVNKLEELQNSFYRNLLNVPFTTPKPALIWEVAGMKMKYRIMMSKILFLHHIISLDDDSLAKQIQSSQHKYQTPGLTKEVQGFMEELELPSCLEVAFTKSKWKNLVKKAIKKANESEIRKSIEPYKKMKHLSIENETFECKQYLSTLPLEKARTLFKHKFKMTENVKMNYKNDAGFANSLWKCSNCSNKDTESHLLWCPGYADMRNGLNLNADADLCSYLQKIFSVRCKEKK